MATFSEALRIAAQHHQAGRLDLAEEIYQRILQVEPSHADALHLLGVMACQRGEYRTAVESIERAIMIDPDKPAYHSNLGETWRAMGRTADAIGSYRRAVDLDPTNAIAHNNLGNALLDRGDAEQAIPCYRRATELRAQWSIPYFNLGLAWNAAGHSDQAISCYERAVELDPHHASAWYNLGCDYHRKRRFREAVKAFRESIRLRPEFGNAYNNLGVALVELGRPAEAIASFAAARRFKPETADVLSNLGGAYQEQRQTDEAIGCFRRALQLDPGHVNAWNHLGGTYQDQGRLDEAIASYRESLRLDPNFAVARSNYLCALRCHPEATLAALKTVHAEYDQLHAAPLRAAWRPHQNVRQAERVLRMGFVSPQFLRGAIGSFLIRALESLSREKLHIACYSDSPLADDVTVRLRAASDVWRDVNTASDDELADQIRSDSIDLLVDLAGHAPRNRLLVFARKPAPLQITWIDSVGTTGLSAMDFLIADRYLVPPNAEPYYVEKILRLPDGYVCYAPPAEAAPVAPPPALQRGCVTLGSFNRAAKIHPGVVSLWSKILHRVPGSRLVLKYSGLESHGAAEHYHMLFEAEGVGRSRIELQGHSPLAEYFNEYSRIDLTLDPFPHNGGLTTCDSLWSGVPVVTCPGETFASRQSLSHLSNVGLTETIARDLDEYVEIAVRLASDLPRLARIRAGLRDRVARSPLCNGKRFTENLLGLLRGIWRDWCEGTAPI